MKYIALFPALFILFISCSRQQPAEPSANAETLHPLQGYLQKSDSSWQYEKISVLEHELYTAYVIRMVSGEWLAPQQVSETEWWHYLTIVVPENVQHTTGLISVGGGSKNSDVPEAANPIAVEAALKTNSVTAYLHNVPFQPVRFLDDPSLAERTEDDLIAYGWRKFLESGAQDIEAEWLARFPMARAVVRAMDTVTDFTEKNLDIAVNNFVLTGASKRGWTAWTTGIFDDRVLAIAPAVIDMLNIEPSFLHHWQALGEWSPAIEDYTNEHIMDWLGTPEFNRLLQLADPYSYLDDFNKPVFLVNAASDEFFLPDSWQFYWDDLPDAKNLRYIPNTGHSLRNTDAHTSLISFYQHILAEKNPPQFTWAVSDSGMAIQYNPEQPPQELLLWNAHNPAGRDFRLYVIDRIWLAQNIEPDSSGNVFVPIESPAAGFTAWFVEAVFYDEQFEPFTVTTGVKVLPDTYPHDAFVPNRDAITRASPAQENPAEGE